MITGINSRRTFSVMTTHGEAKVYSGSFADNFGNLSKNNVGHILVDNHAVIITGIHSPNYFFGRQCVCACVWMMEF